MLANTTSPPPFNEGNNVVDARVPSILSMHSEGNGGQFAAQAMGKRVKGDDGQVASAHGKGDDR